MMDEERSVSRYVEEEIEALLDFSSDCIFLDEQELEIEEKTLIIDFPIHAERDFMEIEFSDFLTSPEAMFFYLLTNYKMHTHLMLVGEPIFIKV